MIVMTTLHHAMIIPTRTDMELDVLAKLQQSSTIRCALLGSRIMHELEVPFNLRLCILNGIITICGSKESTSELMIRNI